jgi:hypothetical protein
MDSFVPRGLGGGVPSLRTLGIVAIIENSVSFIRKTIYFF